MCIVVTTIDFLPVSDLMTLCPDIQLPQSKPVCSCSIRDGIGVVHRPSGCVKISICLRGLGCACGLISSATYCISPDRAVPKKITRASAIPSRIRSSVMHTRGRNGSRAITVTLCLLDLQRPVSVSVISWSEYTTNCTKTLHPSLSVHCGVVLVTQVPKTCPFSDMGPSGLFSNNLDITLLVRFSSMSP